MILRTTEAVCHDRPFRYVPRIHFVEVKISLCSAASTQSRNAPILATARQFALINSNYRCQVSVRHRILKPLTFDRMNRTEVQFAQFSNMACSLLICMQNSLTRQRTPNSHDQQAADRSLNVDKLRCKLHRIFHVK